MTLVVGLTGGIGSGKSAAADCFAAQGITVVDTDAIAHELAAAGGAASGGATRRRTGCGRQRSGHSLASSQASPSSSRNAPPKVIMPRRSSGDLALRAFTSAVFSQGRVSRKYACTCGSQREGLLEGSA